MKRIGLIGGISWESTASYYSLLNKMTAQEYGAWKQPALLIDSLDFSEIVAYQQKGDWATLGEMLADSARRLESGGATCEHHAQELRRRHGRRLDSRR